MLTFRTIRTGRGTRNSPVPKPFTSQLLKPDPDNHGRSPWSPSDLCHGCLTFNIGLPYFPDDPGNCDAARLTKYNDVPGRGGAIETDRNPPTGTALYTRTKSGISMPAVTLITISGRAATRLLIHPPLCLRQSFRPQSAEAVLNMDHEGARHVGFAVTRRSAGAVPASGTNGSLIKFPASTRIAAGFRATVAP